MHCGGVGGGSKVFMGRKKKSLPILPNTHYKVSDHYFAALVIVRAVGIPDRCQLGKAGGSQAITNPHPVVSGILNRI